MNIFLNEPDLYEKIDFSKYLEITNVFKPTDIVPYNTIDAVMVGLKDIIDDNFLKIFPNVQYIVSNTTGVDHIQTTRDINIINLNPKEIENVTATAEFSLALMLSLVRKIPFINNYKVWDRKALRGRQFSSMHLGVIGVGRLGKKMIKFAEALGMKHSSFDKKSNIAERKALFEKSDIISIHIPLNEETIDFINYKEFDLMKKKPYLINSSRSQIINKKALMYALDNNLIEGCAMDFINYDASNNWDPNLKKYKNNKLLLTPHIGGNTFESIQHTTEVVLIKWLNGLSKKNKNL